MNPQLSTACRVRVRVRVRVTLRLAVYRQSVGLGAEPLETHGQNFFFQLNTCGHSPYVTSSLTRGWVCRLQLLLALANAFSSPSPAGLMTTFYCHRFEAPPTWSLRPRIYIPQEQGGTVIPPALGTHSNAYYDSQGYGGGNSKVVICVLH
jgi:hypothetical protein